jgi:hypothetical protein
MRTFALTLFAALAVASPVRAQPYPTAGTPHSMPERMGQCVLTKVTSIDTEDDIIWKEIHFENGGVEVSDFDATSPAFLSKVGDPIKVCLASLPHDCPPGDARGRIYLTTNLRTGGKWSFSDTIHMCGGQ